LPVANKKYVFTLSLTTAVWGSEMKQNLCVCVAIVLSSLASTVWAQTPSLVSVSSTSTNSDPLVAYNAYNEAVNAGKLPEAATFGNLAWQLAEAKWGSSNPNTAGLAFNAAWSSALIGKSAERIDAARRAVELAPIATASYSVQEAQFLLAYGEYFAADQNGRLVAARKLSAAAQPVEGTWNDFLIINALISSANMGVGSNFGRATIAVADRALAVIDRLAPNDTTNRALAYLARGRGRLTAGIDREEAVADFVQARLAYGPMRGVDDLSWGTLAAWETASRSVLTTINNFLQTTGSRIASRTRRALDMTPEQLKLIYAEATDDPLNPLKCEGVRRDPSVGENIKYPNGEANDYRVAGVVVRINLNSDGTVIAPRLLGAVPPGSFGTNAATAISGWKYIIPADTPAACLKNKEIIVNFVIQ
jgi:tetratricopeptide (TPR) repeat protein